ncbi:uncharacterized protein [Rutidosis leptorrhynchoides]|uniref:uncharacterized protein n=1 Tax=Rutidosis leptorrhynchoides TaxID=125765 RepID=UPI003A9A4F4B
MVIHCQPFFLKAKSNGLIPSNTLRVKIENGSSVKLWKDNWRGDGSLSTKYHRLYHLESNPNCCLSERLVNENWIWDWCRNDIGSRNEASLHQMISEIGSPTIINSIDDRWEWCISEDGIFNVSSTRKSLDTILLPSTDVKISWFNQVSRKVNIFLWRVAWDRLPTRLNISSRGMDINDIGCLVYNCQVESLNHVLFNCFLARELWSKIKIWINESYVTDFDSWVNWFDWFQGWQINTDSKIKLYVIMAAYL